MEQLQNRWLFATDLDGTLRTSRGTFLASDIDALHLLGELGVVRAVVTGRSLYSLRRDVSQQLPLDYIVFSTGAGVLRCGDQIIIEPNALTPAEVKAVTSVLEQMRLNYMVHLPIPENHRFYYCAGETPNGDFLRRIALYRGHCWPGRELTEPIAACQVIAVVDSSIADEMVERVRTSLATLSVVRTTSPIDNRFTWIEIFPQAVSKGQAVQRLAQRHAVSRDHTVAVGNDYNDVDMLDWVAFGLVVENAPDELKRQYRCVPDNDSGGVSQAAQYIHSSRRSLLLPSNSGKR